MKKAIINIAAGPSQIPVIKKAKELGYSVLAIDKNRSAPGFAFCDEQIICSTYDHVCMIEKLRHYEKKYDFVGVINRSSGPPVVTTAHISAFFQLPGITPYAAELFMNKDKLAIFCDENNIPRPKTLIIKKSTWPSNLNIKFPCIIKPSLSLVGKKGVYFVKNFNEFQRKIKIALKYTKNGHINIEEYIHGRDVSLISFIANKKLMPFCLVDEINIQTDDGRIIGYAFAIPSIFQNTPAEEKIYKIANKIIDTLQLNTSPFLISFRCNTYNYCPKVIEIHLDLGGDFLIECLFPNSLNIDFLKTAIKILTQQEININCQITNPTAIVFLQNTERLKMNNVKVYQANTRNKLEELILGDISYGNA